MGHFWGSDCGRFFLPSSTDFRNVLDTSRNFTEICNGRCRLLPGVGCCFVMFFGQEVLATLTWPLADDAIIFWGGMFCPTKIHNVCACKMGPYQL